jgi:hypothetical protein
LQVPVLQASLIALQSTGVPGLHFAAATSQVSTPLHGLPSSHFGSFGVVQGHWVVSWTQPPLCSLQLSELHASPSSQLIAVPWQTPAVHESFFVQTRPSLHGAPSDLAGCEHAPVVGSQTPAS